MELWIRSQDKECLIKVNDIAIEQNMIIGYFDKDTEYEYLGQYKSKERALEVLDEIQNLLIPKGIIKFNDLIKQEDIKTLKENFDDKYMIFNKNVELLQQYETLVYQMPKE